MAGTRNLFVKVQEKMVIQGGFFMKFVLHASATKLLAVCSYNQPVVSLSID